MDVRAVCYALGNVVLVLGGALLVPVAVALIYAGDHPDGVVDVFALAVTAAAALAVGLTARLIFRADPGRIRTREGYAIVTVGWVIASLIGMIPYLVSGATSSVAAAFFETVSGFTTTGATVFPRVEVLLPGVQFWRCLTQWLGGMGIVVLSVALMPAIGAGGYLLVKAEAPGGVAFERERPRITDTAKEMWLIYVALSVAEAILLRLGGMSTYDALCHTFTTLSTGGFSPHTDSLAFFPSPFLQWVCIAFMVLAGANFTLYARALRGNLTAVWRDSELKVYVGILALCTGVGIAVAPWAGDLEALVRTVLFQVASIATTTGYATHDFDSWPSLLRLLLVLLMLVGACMGSTAGGLKVGRVVVFAKAVAREMHRPFFPHAVRPIRINGKVVDQALVANIMAFGSLYSATFVAGAVVMAASGYDLVTSLSASAAALGNIGPGLALVGPAQHWGHLPELTKVAMSLIMLAGRLELYSFLILLTPWVWRR